MHYLRAKGWYVMRLNSGKYSVGEGRAKRFIMGQDAGTPDVMAFKSGHIVFCEVKRPGKKATLLQKAKMEELEQYGAKCIIATCIEDIEKAI